MIKITNLLSAIALVIVTFSNNTTAQIIPAKFGKGFNIKGVDSTFQLKIGFRFQNLIEVNWNRSDAENGFTASNDVDAFVRRSRLKFDGWAFTPKLKYKLELALSNRDNGGGGNLDEFNNAANIILDAHITYNFYKGFSVRFGQGKLAGNRERVISSGNLQFVDRSRLNSRFNIDRDVFLRLMHKHTLGDNFIVKESASIQSGEGKNHTTGFNGGFGYTFRMEFLPFGSFQSKGDYVGSSIKRESKPKLSLGFTYDTNRNAARERGQNGSFITDQEGSILDEELLSNLNTFFADLMFKYQGLSIMCEYVDKVRSSDPDVIDLFVPYFTGSSYNLSAGYMFSNNMEVALRYTDVSADIATDENHYTIGINKFFVGHKLKIQTDFSVVNREDSQDFLLWRTQMDIHF